MSIRDGLRVAPSTIPGAKNGLFTTKPLKRGDFLGFYCGREVEASAFGRVKEKDYAMEIADGVSFVANPARKKDRMAMINEAPANRHANVLFHPYHLTDAFQRPVATAVAVYAAEAIPPKRELFTHYGSSYDRVRKTKGYKVGSPAAAIPVSLLQDPRDVLAYLPLDAFVAIERRRK